MTWKTSLDRYLTNPPDDGLDGYCEATTDHFSEEWFKQNEDWALEYSVVCNKWFNKLFYKGTDPKDAAKIIERAYRLYQSK